MILIADSGSTKTDWILLDLDSRSRTYFEGIGLNPYYSERSEITHEANTLFASLNSATVSHIYFYGAGCSSRANKKVVSDGLGDYFNHSKIEVFHDLEGAARSLCKTTEGIACILGTGSNAAHFDGKKVVQQAVSLGYLLGDEGSGNHIGKKLIHSIYLHTAPKDLINDFQETFELSLEDLLAEIYQNPYPNRFLASFTKYISQKKEQPFVLDLIHKSFEEFIQLVVLPLNPQKNLPVHFTGSIAWFFKNELGYILKQEGFILGEITQKPIDNLVEYHLINRL